MNSVYKNGDDTTTPFYISGINKIKCVSIKKKCTSMSFYYKSYAGSVYLYIDGVYKSQYTSTSWKQVSVTDLTDEEHEFTWVLKTETSNNNDSYLCIDTISFNDELITDINEFNNEYKIPLADIPTEYMYKTGDDSTTPFYTINGIKAVSIKKKCTSTRFYYKTNNGDVYLYIDGEYKSRYNSGSSWCKTSYTNLTDKEHEFTWILIVNSTNGYSCIDSIIFNNETETVTDINKFNNIINNSLSDRKETTPFFVRGTQFFKCVSIKKRCTNIKFDYFTAGGCAIYLYIDGELKKLYYEGYYSSRSQLQESITNLTDKEHEFTWVLATTYSNYYIQDNYKYSYIDNISFDGKMVTDINEFNNKKTFTDNIINGILLKNNNHNIKFGLKNSSFKTISIKKKCTSMSFYYSAYSGYVYLYIDGVYINYYSSSSSSWTQASVTNLTYEEHEFVWILFNYNDGSYIDTIRFDNELATDINEFNNDFKIPLANIPINNIITFSTKDGNSVNCVSIKKKCTSMSFSYASSDYSYVYLYIDGVFKNRYEKTYSYSNKSWTQISITDLTDEEHEFTWIMIKNTEIDNISFNDELATDINEFNNEYDIPLVDISTENVYKNGNDTTTPFYNNNRDINKFKCVSFKERSTNISFYYKTNNGYVYLYIDGIYKGSYNSSSWTQASVTNLTYEEHEFVWILFNYSDNIDAYSCIDTIRIGRLVTDINEFNTEYKIPLADIPTEDTYKNGNDTTTPFYTNGIIKHVTIKKKCTSMSFYSKIPDYSYVYLYIDGVYKNRYDYSYALWKQVSVTDLTDEEHEFTWVLFGLTGTCIDTISFDSEVVTDMNTYYRLYDGVNNIIYLNDNTKRISNNDKNFIIDKYNNLWVKGNNEFGDLGVEYENANKWVKLSYIDNIKEIKNKNNLSILTKYNDDNVYYSGLYNNIKQNKFISSFELKYKLKLFNEKNNIYRKKKWVYNKNNSDKKYIELFSFEEKNNFFNFNLFIEGIFDIINCTISGNNEKNNIYTNYSIINKYEYKILITQKDKLNLHKVYLYIDNIKNKTYFDNLFVKVDSVHCNLNNISINDSGIIIDMEELISKKYELNDGIFDSQNGIQILNTKNNDFYAFNISVDIGNIKSIINDININESEYENKNIIPYEDEEYKGPQFLYPIFFNLGIPYNKFVKFEGKITLNGKEYLTSYVKISEPIDINNKFGTIQFLFDEDVKLLSDVSSMYKVTNRKKDILFGITLYPIKIEDESYKYIIDDKFDNTLVNQHNISNIFINEYLIKDNCEDKIVLLEDKCAIVSDNDIYIFDLISLKPIYIKHFISTVYNKINFIGIKKNEKKYVIKCDNNKNYILNTDTLDVEYETSQDIETEDKIFICNDIVELNSDNVTQNVKDEYKNKYNILNNEIKIKEFRFENDENYFAFIFDENSGFYRVSIYRNNMINNNIEDESNFDIIPGTVESIDGLLLCPKEIVRNGYPKSFMIK